MSIEIRDIRANGFEFCCRVAGAEGEPVILLHGFPETSAQWTESIADLVAAGYRCLAPDQRGYSPGARPRGVDECALDRHAVDVVALADACDFGRVHLVLWGNRDPYIGRPATRLERSFMRGPYRFVELDAGHFLSSAAGDVCRAEILAHVRANPIAGARSER